MTTLYEHRIFCNTENTWVYLWKADQILLTTCPNNPAHTVQPGSASIINEQGPDVVQIQKEPGFQTNGHGRCDAIVLAAPAGGQQSVTKTWPLNIALYTFRLAIDASCVGCALTLEAAPRTTVGVLTGGILAGTTILPVSAQAAALINPGYIITLSANGGTTVQELGRAITVDTVNNLITVEIATLTPFPSGALVQITARAADNVPLAIPGMLQFGGEFATAINWPAGQSLVATLTNPNAQPANLTVYITYRY